MILVSSGQQILRTYITNRIPGFLFRSESSVASAPNEQNVDQISEPNLPDLDENPFIKEKKVCILCKYNIEPDYKNVRMLSQFQSRYTGRIYGKHITGLCQHKQTRVEQEILKAQNAGLMGYMTKEPKFVNDPKLFDPNFPFRPHKY